MRAYLRGVTNTLIFAWALDEHQTLLAVAAGVLIALGAAVAHQECR